MKMAVNIQSLLHSLKPGEPDFQIRIDQAKKFYEELFVSPVKPDYFMQNYVANLVWYYTACHRGVRNLLELSSHNLILEHLLPLLCLPGVRQILDTADSTELVCSLIGCPDARLDPLVAELVAKYDYRLDLPENLAPTLSRIALLEERGHTVANSKFLAKAIRLGESNIDAVTMLLDQGAEPNTLDVSDALSCVTSGPLVDLLISRGFNLKRYGSRLIRLAMGQWRGDQAFLDYLVGNKELIKQFKPGTQTLRIAIKKRETALAALIVRLLPPSKLAPSLEYACQKGNHEIVTMLLERDTPVNARCLAMAFKMIEPRCLELMLNAGGDLDKISRPTIERMIRRLPESPLRVKLETQLVAAELTEN